MKKILIITVLAGITAIASGSTKYHVLDLTDLAQQSGADIIPATNYAVNDAGMITGHGHPVSEDANAKPFLYIPSTRHFINIGNLLGSFTHGLGGNGYAINQKGMVTGRDSISDTSYLYRPFLFYDANGNGNVDPCELQNLMPEANAGDANSRWATGINDCNHVQVVGFNLINSSGGWVWTDKNGNLQYDDGEKQYFSSMTPVGINNSHQIVLTTSDGNSVLWNDPNGDGIYEDGDRQIMPMPATFSSMSAAFINNSGAISGSIKNNNSKTDGFYWEDLNHNGIVETNEITIIGIIVPTVNTYARAMNNHGVIVGGTYVFNSADRKAFIWTKDSNMININDVASYTDPNYGPVSFSQAEGINNNGVIVVSGYFDLNHDGKEDGSDPEHTFVLTPYGDINGSGYVNFQDFSILAANYGYTNCSQPNQFCNGADINEDGVVDWKDVKIIVDNWLTTVSY